MSSHCESNIISIAMNALVNTLHGTLIATHVCNDCRQSACYDVYAPIVTIIFPDQLHNDPKNYM